MGTQGVQGEERPGWALPKPSKPRRPPGEDARGIEGLPWSTEGQEEKFASQEYPTPQQRLIEADKRRKRRLAALARDHIIKLREERQRLAYDWLGEYSERAAFS